MKINSNVVFKKVTLIWLICFFVSFVFVAQSGLLTLFKIKSHLFLERFCSQCEVLFWKNKMNISCPAEGLSCQCGDSDSQNASGQLGAQLSADVCWTESVTAEGPLTFLSTVFEDHDLVLKGQEGAFIRKPRTAVFPIIFLMPLSWHNKFCYLEITR